MEDGRTTKVAQNKKIKGEAHRRTEERKEQGAHTSFPDGTTYSITLYYSLNYTQRIFIIMRTYNVRRVG